MWRLFFLLRRGQRCNGNRKNEVSVLLLRKGKKRAKANQIAQPATHRVRRSRSNGCIGLQDRNTDACPLPFNNCLKRNPLEPPSYKMGLERLEGGKLSNFRTTLFHATVLLRTSLFVCFFVVVVFSETLIRVSVWQNCCLASVGWSVGRMLDWLAVNRIM